MFKDFLALLDSHHQDLTERPAARRTVSHTGNANTALAIATHYNLKPDRRVDKLSRRIPQIHSGARRVGQYVFVSAPFNGEILARRYVPKYRRGPGKLYRGGLHYTADPKFSPSMTSPLEMYNT